MEELGRSLAAKVAYVRVGTRQAPKISNSTSPLTTACTATPGARSFGEGVVHIADPDLRPAIKANKTSCISSGCHDVVHDVGKLKDAKFWKEQGKMTLQAKLR